MYSTHFYRNTSLYGYVLFITLSTPPQEEEEVEERASLLAAVYHPSKELNQKPKLASNSTIQYASNVNPVGCVSVLSK